MGTSTINTELEADADAIAIAFAQESASDLPGWTARHPEHARTLARLATETYFPLAPSSPPSWSVASSFRSATQPLGTRASEGDGGAARVREIGLGVLAARRPALSSLLLAIRAEGLELEEAAVALQLPEGLLWKLHRRFVALESVPAALLGQLAETVRRSVEEVRAYLAQPPMLATGASYRADTAPEAHQESFESALSADPETTDAMRSHWLPG
jgi:hypothetical protein